jgi:hypothetical protein
MCLARTLLLRQVNKRYHGFHRRVLSRRLVWLESEFLGVTQVMLIQRGAFS